MYLSTQAHDQISSMWKELESLHKKLNSPSPQVHTIVSSHVHCRQLHVAQLDSHHTAVSRSLLDVSMESMPKSQCIS